MLKFILQRLLTVTPVALGVSVVCFLLVHLAPGDPLSAVLPVDATQETIDAMRAAYGYDKPLPVQYVIWLWHVLQGDLGISIATGRPVVQEVGRAVVNSLILASVATLIGFTFGCLFGFVAGYFRNSILDRLASAVSVFGVSVPHYWLGMVLVIVFSAQLGWLPPTGAGPDGSG
ncbi:MAG: ABC transporter permease, partial [Methylobacteriaceae bacterium]